MVLSVTVLENGVLRSAIFFGFVSSIVDISLLSLNLINVVPEDEL